MDYVGLLFEVVILATGVYLYLFALGKLPMKNQSKDIRQRAEEFRKRNQWWLRISGLALIAIGTVNLALHIAQLIN